MSLDLSAALRRHLLQRFPADRDYPRAALYAAGMPPLIGGFLGRTLDRWVEIERAQIHSDWFDFANPDVQQAEARFFDALARTARIPAAAWKGTLGGTVDLVVRYLTTPSRALTDAIFEGSADPLPADDVRARLAMFDAYPYFAEVGGAYLERKRTESLEPPDLFGLLDRIDRRVVSEFGPDEWIDLLAPLFALARQVPAFDGVPTPLLKRFFEMKGEPDLAMPLGKHPRLALDEEALRSLIAGVLEDEASDPVDVAPVRTNGHARTPAPEAAPAPEVARESEFVPDTEATEPEDTKPGPAEPDLTESDLTESDLTEPDLAEPDLAEPELVEPEAPEPSEPETSEPELTMPTATPVAETEGAQAEEPEVAEPESADSGAADARDVDEFEAAESAESEEDLEAESDEEDGEAVPLWQRFASGGDANVNAQFSTDSAETPADVDEAASASGEAPLWKRFFGRPDERLSAPPLPAEEKSAPADRPARATSLEELERRVLGASTSGQRSRFVKHLFGGDAGKYATVLHALDAADSWTEASQIIARDVFRPFRVNIYGEHAVAFTDAVEARFRT